MYIILTTIFHKHTLDKRLYIANKVHSTDLPVIFSFPTSVRGVMVLLYSKLK